MGVLALGPALSLEEQFWGRGLVTAGVCVSAPGEGDVWVWHSGPRPWTPACLWRLADPGVPVCSVGVVLISVLGTKDSSALSFLQAASLFYPFPVRCPRGQAGQGL